MSLSSAWDLQRAIWQTLSSDPDLTAVLGGPAIHDDIPQGEPFPYVTIGEIRTNDWSTQSSKGHEHFLMLHAWSRTRGRRQVQAAMHGIEAALDGAALTLSKHNLINLRLVFWDARRDPDGKTYHAVMRFRAVTEPKEI